MTKKDNPVTDNAKAPKTGDVSERKKKNKVVEKILAQKKVDKSTGQTQYPKDLGYHGTDAETSLNPEE